MVGTQFCFERYEKKYMLTRAQRDALLARIGGYLTPDTYPVYTICNLYYDTDDYRLIRASIDAPVYKEKLRVPAVAQPRALGAGDLPHVVFQIRRMLPQIHPAVRGAANSEGGSFLCLSRSLRGRSP